MIENIRNRVDVKLIGLWETRYGMQSQIAKPNFKRSVIFNENLAACELSRLNIYMSKPIIVGASILDISKCKMYSFHYDFILKHFSHETCQIQYTDTDSFIYNFKCDDFYSFIRNHSNEFDTSDFAENNPYGIKRLNKKIVGKMKDEYACDMVKEFIGLRSKMYAIKTHENKVSKRGKGIKKCVLDRKISFEDYKKCLNEHCTLFRNQAHMKSHLRNMYNVSYPKKVLDPFDDKRYIIPNTHCTLACGHFKISADQEYFNRS